MIHIRLIDGVKVWGGTLPSIVPWSNVRPYHAAPVETLEGDGVYPAQFAEIPDGHQKTSESWAIVDGVAVQSIVTEPIPARVPSVKLMADAESFKIAMERTFGEGAHLNQAITEGYVYMYFKQLSDSGQATAAQTTDGVTLMRTFPAITDFTGDGTVWSFPWSLLDSE